MTDQIREKNIALNEQVEFITTLRAERDASKEVIRALYIMLVKFRPDFLVKTGKFAELEYPPLRAEDVTRLNNSEMVRQIGAVFRVVSGSVDAMATEINSIYRELDQSVDDAMEKWRVIRAQEFNINKAHAFRDSPAAPSGNARAPTPEVPLVNRPRVDSAAPSPPPVVGTQKKSDPKPASPTEKKKGNGKPLEKVMAAASASSPFKKT